MVISKGDGTIERRQDAPKVWEFNGSIYVLTSTRLKEVGLSKLNRIRKYVMDDLHSIDIDKMCIRDSTYRLLLLLPFRE